MSPFPSIFFLFQLFTHCAARQSRPLRAPNALLYPLAYSHRLYRRVITPRFASAPRMYSFFQVAMRVPTGIAMSTAETFGSSTTLNILKGRESGEGCNF
jgi:hypothetical protein